MARAFAALASGAGGPAGYGAGGRSAAGGRGGGSTGGGGVPWGLRVPAWVRADLAAARGAVPWPQYPGDLARGTLRGAGAHAGAHP